jgi:hypothetical protein
MKPLLITVFLIAAFAVRAQTTVTPYQALHPIMKDRNKRNAPTSLDRDPSEKADLEASAPTRQPGRPAAFPPAQPAKPVEIVARIDAGLAASRISLLGTVHGLKGGFYVTNLSPAMITPLAQFAVCDLNGFQVGSTARTGPPLAPNDAEKIEVLATNFNAVDLKLVKLTASPAKK